MVLVQKPKPYLRSRVVPPSPHNLVACMYQLAQLVMKMEWHEYDLQSNSKLHPSDGDNDVKEPTMIITKTTYLHAYWWVIWSAITLMGHSRNHMLMNLVFFSIFTPCPSTKGVDKPMKCKNPNPNPNPRRKSNRETRGCSLFSCKIKEFVRLTNRWGVVLDWASLSAHFCPDRLASQ